MLEAQVVELVVLEAQRVKLVVFVLEAQMVV